MKVLFLDFDGVLNNDSFKAAQIAEGHEDPYACDHFDPTSVAALNTILERSGAKVVISSSWRTWLDLEELRRVLEENGVRAEVIGATPDGNDLWPAGPACRRGNEIQRWLDEHPEVSSFVILDDGLDMLHLSSRQVVIDERVGLGHLHVSPALELLGP